MIFKIGIGFISIFAIAGTNGLLLKEGGIFSKLKENFDKLFSPIHSTGTEINNIVTFRLFTRVNPDSPEELVPGNLSTLLKGRISLPIKVVSHGFREKGTDEAWEKAKEAFLKEMDVNVIIVDWGNLATFPAYFSVARRVKLVGQYLGELLAFLIKEGADPKNMHLIGFSLGSHVVGNAGAALKPITVARITGLDPAYPGFENVDMDERLDPADSDFVDVIHTCGEVYGFYKPLGHADFYVNGGKRQPGCFALDFGTCSHRRAWQYFIESINPNFRFPSEICEAIPEMGSSGLRTNYYSMGNYLDTKAKGIFFTKTETKEPFAPVRS